MPRKRNSRVIRCMPPMKRTATVESDNTQLSSGSDLSVSSARNLMLSSPQQHFRQFREGFVRYIDIFHVFNEAGKVEGQVFRIDVMENGSDPNLKLPRRTYIYGDFKPEQFECNEATAHSAQCRVRSVHRRGECHCEVPVGEEHAFQSKLDHLEPFQRYGFR